MIPIVALPARMWHPGAMRRHGWLGTLVTIGLSATAADCETHESHTCALAGCNDNLQFNLSRPLIEPGEYQVDITPSGGEPVRCTVLVVDSAAESGGRAGTAGAGSSGHAGAAGSGGVGGEGGLSGMGGEGGTRGGAGGTSGSVKARCGLPRVAVWSGQSSITGLSLLERPASAEIVISRSGTQVASGSFTPSYEAYYPNGPACAPVCERAMVTLNVP